MRTLIYLLALVTTASAAPTRLVAGETLSVLDVEPVLAQGAYIAQADSKLAERLRTSLTVALTDGEKQRLNATALPSGLFLVKIAKDLRSGKRYLYKPCDGGSHARTLITDTQVWMLGGNEQFVVPIAAKRTRDKVTTFDLDTSGLPPMVANKIVLRATDVADVYELGGELVATPAATAKLDVVVRVCKKAKIRELDFSK